MMPIAECYHYGFPGPVGAHPVARELPTPTRSEALGGVLTAPLQGAEILQIEDSRTYTLTIHRAHPLTNAAVQAKGDQRPYVRVTTDDGMAGDAANLTPAVPVDGETRTFRLEGAWIGSASDTRPDFVVERAASGTGFDWDEIVLRGATLDPGGVRGDGTPITPVRLRIIGRVKRLVIDQCIVGPILVEQLADCAESGFVDELIIRDSIVDALQFEPKTAIDCVTGRVELERVTVLGNVDVALIEASDSIIMGTIDVLNQQASCLRFSAVSPGGSLPRLFEVFGPPRPSEFVAGTPIVPAFFTSLRFGDPGYAQLSVVAPLEIAQGAENGSEMGSFSSLLRPIRLNSVIDKVDEFKPAGVIAQYILEGEHAPRSSEDGGH